MSMSDKIGDKESRRKSAVIAEWEGIKFRLYIPKVISAKDKPEVQYSWLNPDTNKKVQLKTSVGIDRNATEKKFTKQAEILVEGLMGMLKNGYNPITGAYPDNVKLTNLSTLDSAISGYLKIRKDDYEAGAMKKNGFVTTGIIMNYQREYFKSVHSLSQKPDTINTSDITQMMRKLEKDRKLSPFSYNSYLNRITSFWKFLLNERVITHNPATAVVRYKTGHLDTRFKIFEDDELEKVRGILKDNPRYTDLLIVISLLYSYRIRGAEQLMIQIKMIF